MRRAKPQPIIRPDKDEEEEPYEEENVDIRFPELGVRLMNREWVSIASPRQTKHQQQHFPESDPTAKLTFSEKNMFRQLTVSGSKISEADLGRAILGSGASDNRAREACKKNLPSFIKKMDALRLVVVEEQDQQGSYFPLVPKED